MPWLNFCPAQLDSKVNSLSSTRTQPFSSIRSSHLSQYNSARKKILKLLSKKILQLSAKKKYPPALSQEKKLVLGIDDQLRQANISCVYFDSAS